MIILTYFYVIPIVKIIHDYLTIDNFFIIYIAKIYIKTILVHS